MATPSFHSLEVTRTARVATIGPSDAPEWWMGLHGYGQRAADFVEAFDPVAGADRYVVAPEALSRFYVDGLGAHEEVGASWMTRADRDNEIDDYVSYLDATVRHLRPDGHVPSTSVLGFSQGAATASRWALLGDTTIDRLVLWGGAPAHDLDLSAHADRLRTMKLTIVVGTKDPHVTDDQRAAVRRRLDEHDIPATIRTFEGGHRLDDDVLKTVLLGDS
jgi:predicted esterase